MIAGRLVAVLGGRYSVELGIDLDADPDGRAVDRWFLACTLFATRIAAAVAVRTYGVLEAAGVATVADAGHRTWDELVELLDRGGYTRYDFRTASRLLELAGVIAERHGGSVATLAAETDPGRLDAALRAIPGWGPTTASIFLRELRDVWPGAAPPVADRAWASARHLELVGADEPADRWAKLVELAPADGLDPRDLEAGLVRLALDHGRRFEACPGGDRCIALSPA